MTTTFYRSVCIAIVTLALSGLAIAHGKKKHAEDVETSDFDAVSNEFGSYEAGLAPAHTITVSMADTMRFTPSSVDVKAGEVVRFIVSNEGQLQHEFVLGTRESLSEHNELMKKFPGMEHEEPYMAHVDPGKKMEIIWQFSKAGTFEFACLLPGHFDAGMKGTITVSEL